MHALVEALHSMDCMHMCKNGSVDLGYHTRCACPTRADLIPHTHADSPLADSPHVTQMSRDGSGSTVRAAAGEAAAHKHLLISARFDGGESAAKMGHSSNMTPSRSRARAYI